MNWSQRPLFGLNETCNMPEQLPPTKPDQILRDILQSEFEFELELEY